MKKLFTFFVAIFGMMSAFFLVSSVDAATTSNLSPTAVGNFSQWAKVPLGGPSTKVSVLATNDGDDSYLVSAINNHVQTMSVANAGVPAGATINSVTLYVVAKPYSWFNLTKRFTLGVENGGIFNEGEEISVTSNNSTSSYATYSRVMNTNPLTASAWTVAEVNNWTTNFGISRTNGVGFVLVTQMYVVVDYTPDTTKPTASFITPTLDQVYSGDSVAVQLEASDDSEIASVVINIRNPSGAHIGTCYNNGSVNAPTLTADCTINTSSYDDGRYQLRAGILDVAGNRLTIITYFIVDKTKPNVAITTPENGAAVKGSFVVSGTADDATSGISEVLYTVNQISALGGSFVASIANGVANGTTIWDYSVSDLIDGFYRLRVQAFDFAGNWRYRYHDVQVDNTKPVTSVVSPAADGTFDENFTITINSVDGGSQVKSAIANLYGPSGLIGSCANETFDPTQADVDFTCDIDVDSLADGAYYIKTNTRDAAGNLSNTVTWNFTIERPEPGGPVTPVCSSEDEELCEPCIGEECLLPEPCEDGYNFEEGECVLEDEQEEQPEVCEDGYVLEEEECVLEDEEEQQPEVCYDEVESTEQTTVDAVAHSQSTPLVTETTVVAGDQLMITAVGTWRAGESDEPASRESDADGLDGYAPYNGFKFGALVGRIGGGDWFLVGTSFDQEVTETGTLELVYRDSNHADNSGSVEVTITKTTTEEIECSEECTGEGCEDDTPPSTPPVLAGGAASSIGSSSTGPSTLLTTGPQEDEETEENNETGDQDDVSLRDAMDQIDMATVSACNEDDYILERHTALKRVPEEMIYTIPVQYLEGIGSHALRGRNQLLASFDTATTDEERNDLIRAFVCNIEVIKEARGLRHAHIGFRSGGSDFNDYLLQYLQDIAILHFVK